MEGNSGTLNAVILRANLSSIFMELLGLGLNVIFSLKQLTQLVPVSLWLTDPGSDCQISKKGETQVTLKHRF